MRCSYRVTLHHGDSRSGRRSSDHRATHRHERRGGEVAVRGKWLTVRRSCVAKELDRQPSFYFFCFLLCALPCSLATPRVPSALPLLSTRSACLRFLCVFHFCVSLLADETRSPENRAACCLRAAACAARECALHPSTFYWAGTVSLPSSISACRSLGLRPLTVQPTETAVPRISFTVP